MPTRDKIWKLTYYAVEFVILLLGYALIIFFAFDFSIQMMFLVITLLFYITFGLLRHQAERDLTLRVVIEYILISLLVLMLFVFLNNSRI